MFKITVVVLALIASALAKPNPRIVGGTEADEGEFPWQISIQDKILFISSHFCGGSVLNANTILTAGHCVTEAPGLGTVQIYAGITRLSAHSSGQTIRVSNQIVHPDFGGGVGPNDVAILKLASSLTLNSQVTPIKLPAAGDDPQGTATLSGWGVINNNPIAQPPDNLYKIDLPIVTNEDCQTKLGDDAPVADSNICTGPIGGTVSACSGDSGGPLVLQGTNEQIGIVSWGMIPCGSGSPSVFTRVSSFLDFIEQNS